MGRHKRGGILAGVGVVMVLAVAGCGGFFPPVAPPTTTPAPAPGTSTANFVYVANGTGSIAGFTVSTSAAGVGTLTPVGATVPLPLSPTAMAITPANTFLYVAGIGGIYAYSINMTTGLLTTANNGGAEAITATPAASMDISPDGQWLFALSQDGQTLLEYGINPSMGVLAQQAGTTYSPLAGTTVVPKMVRVAPSGASVALALGTGGDAIFPLTTSTGALGPTYQQVGTGNITTSDNGLTFDNASTYLYVARSGATTGVAVYAFNANGTLSQVLGSPFKAGQGPFAVLLDGTGKYLYAANRTDGTVSQFTVSTGGVLTAVTGAAAVAGTAVGSLARDSTGKYLFAAASGGGPDLTMYGFDAVTAGKLNLAVTATTGTDPTAPVVVVATH